MILKNHLEKLQYFYQVAQSGSFKEAAQKINITQPSLTKSIQILEGSVDKKLFTRLPRGVQLTTEGQILFEYCHQLFSQLEDVENKLKAPDDPMAGFLRVGTYDSIAIYFWPLFLRDFLPKYPALNIDLTTDRSTKIQKMVEQGQLDLGLIIEPKETSLSKVLVLVEDRFCLYSSTNAEVVFDSIDEAPLIYMPDALAGDQNLTLTKSHPSLENLGHRRLYKTSSLESTKELLLKGIGMALIPERVAKPEVEAGRIRPVEIEGFPASGVGQHKIGIVYSKHREESQTLQRLIEEIKASY